MSGRTEAAIMLRGGPAVIDPHLEGFSRELLLDARPWLTRPISAWTAGTPAATTPSLTRTGTTWCWPSVNGATATACSGTLSPRTGDRPTPGDNGRAIGPPSAQENGSTRDGGTA